MNVILLVAILIAGEWHAMPLPPDNLEFDSFLECKDAADLARRRLREIGGVEGVAVRCVRKVAQT